MWNHILLLALISLSFTLATMAEASEASNASTNAPETLQVCAQQVPKISGICYISENKMVQLSAQMTSLIQALNDDAKQEQTPETQVQFFESDNNELTTLCSNSRINLIAKDFVQVASQLWSLANRLRNVSETDLQLLTKKKNTLIQQLREVQVFTGPQFTSNAAILHTFQAQVLALERGLNNTMSMLKAERPARTPIDFKLLRKRSATVLKPIKLIVKMYAGDLANFNTTFQHIQSQSSVEQQILGYVTLYGEMMKHSHLDSYELTRLLVQVKQTPELPTSTPPALQSQFAKLKQDNAQILKYVSQNHSCSIKSVALKLPLVTVDPSWPEYTVLHTNPADNNKMKFEPHNGGLTFWIYSGNSLLHTTAGNNYDLAKRHIMETSEMRGLPSNAWKDWKLVPVDGGKYFKILNAQHDEVMFVDPSVRYLSDNYRRVFLKRYEYSAVVEMSAQSDLWALECVPV